MSSLQAERDIGYREGYEVCLEDARGIANAMFEDGHSQGLKQFREFEDQSKTVFYHLTEIFKYLGVEKQPKIVDRYKGYILSEAEALR